jgi:hypothetical protein
MNYKNKEEDIMDKNNTAIINVGNTCCNCLKETKVHNIHIGAMGYGSGFDNFSTQIDLCDECLSSTNPEWWKLERKIAFSDGDYDFKCYEYEDEIFEFVKQMPLAGQELFWGRYGYGACAGYMSGQDWIDYELGILPHKKCKKYGYYSPQEKEAYHKRFSVCDKVKFIIYNDNSNGCHCPFGAFGNNDGTSEGHQTQSGCYKCKMFKTRKNKIETMTREDFDIYELENKLILKKLLKEMKNK